MDNGKIFIQIASYRDPELEPTIRDCIEQASDPNRLVFGICRQYAEEDGFDKLEDWRNDERFRISDVPHSEAKGVCWARNQVQQLYDGEQYTLQLDSHHRFVKIWDDKIVKMFEGLRSGGVEKPLITSYIPSYDPENDPGSRVNVPWKMTFDRFIPEGAVFFLPASIDDFKKRRKPVPGRFYSAHFAFASGDFAVEVQHDPEYYFHGEEISIAVRAYTHGYDIFHPHKVIAWHEYTRKGRTKHWDDDSSWGQRNNKSHLRNRKLFGMDGIEQDIDFGKYGFGTERTLRDYEKYSGLHFGKRAVQKHTLDHGYPPNPEKYASEEEWEGSFTSVFKHCIDVQYSQVPESDYDFWVVAFENDKGETVFRKDADKNECARVKQDPDGYCKVWRTFNAEKIPTKWVVWPHSESKGWCPRIEGLIDNSVS